MEERDVVTGAVGAFLAWLVSGLFTAGIFWMVVILVVSMGLLALIAGALML